MVICGETSLEREVHIKTWWYSLCRIVLWKLLNTCGWIFDACLLLQLKSRSPRGASHHPAFMGNCQTISHTFYSPIYPVDEGNEDVGSVWDTSYCFFLFGVNQVHCFGLKPRGEGSILCVLYQLKSRSSWGEDWNVSRVTLHEFDITFLML